MGGVHRGIRAPAGTAAVLVAMGIGAEAAAAQSAPPARATVQATLTVVQGIDGSSPASLSAFAGAPAPAPALHAGRTGGVVWLPARTGMVAPTPTTGDHGAPAPLPVVRSRTVLPGDGDGPAGVRYTVAVAL